MPCVFVGAQNHLLLGHLLRRALLALVRTVPRRRALHSGRVVAHAHRRRTGRARAPAPLLAARLLTGPDRTAPDPICNIPSPLCYELMSSAALIERFSSTRCFLLCSFSLVICFVFQIPILARVLDTV